MSAVSPPATLPGASWRGELLGALNATAAMLPFVVSYGFIAYGALGAPAAQAGLTASVIAVVLGGAVMAALGGSRLPSASPSASSCLIVAAVVLGLLRDPALTAGAATGSVLLHACVALVVIAGGFLTMLLGALKAGSLVRFVPQPVLAGLMNGVAVLLVLSQIEPMLGLAPGALARDGLRAAGGVAAGRTRGRARDRRRGGARGVAMAARAGAADRPGRRRDRGLAVAGQRGTGQRRRRPAAHRRAQRRAAAARCADAARRRGDVASPDAARADARRQRAAAGRDRRARVGDEPVDGPAAPR
jgi:hypothetical protein